MRNSSRGLPTCTAPKKKTMGNTHGARSPESNTTSWDR